MKKIFILVLGVILLAGCGQKASNGAAENDVLVKAPVVSDTAATTANVPSFAQTAANVSADAVLQPARWSELSFDTAGRVAEVLVAPGDYVEAGAPLVRLDSLALELSLLIAQQEVLAQEAAIRQAVTDNAAQIAQAELDLKITQLGLEQLQTQGADSSVSAAQANLDELELRLEQLRAQDPTPDVTAAQIGVTRAQITYNFWLNEYNKSLEREWEPQEDRDRYASALQQASFDLQLAQANLDSAMAVQQAYNIDLQILGIQIAEARAGLTQALQAQAAYTFTLDIENAQVEAAQLTLDNLRAQQAVLEGVDPNQDPTVARATLEQARLAVEQIQLQLQATELRAPFSGTVVDVRVNVDDQVDENQIVVVVATLDDLEARTTNLSELDVARLQVGQPATVTVDALSGQKFAGVVRHIALRPEIVDDEVTFPVYITLTDARSASGLRWGMNALVEIAGE